MEIRDNYKFPQYIMDRFIKEHPYVKEDDFHYIKHSLYAYLELLRNEKFYAMPSVLVDDLWHLFIIYTKEYTDFCEKFFGKYVHHIPMNSPSEISFKDGYKNTLNEIQQPLIKVGLLKRKELPLIFVIDKKFMKNGYDYNKDAAYRITDKKVSKSSYKSSSSSDSSVSIFGDGDSGGSSGGDGGGGCGGCGG